MRVKYILPLILSVFAFSIFSQPPVWQFVNLNLPLGQSVTIPLYMTELVYQVNITQSTPLQFVQVTVPQSILQQQLQYCKTYDPFITNNISVLQCAFAYPNIVIFYNNPYSSPPSMPNNNAYEIPYYMIVMSYDNVTGLPQTFQIFLNNHVGTLSAGTYYVYVYYGGPYYFPYASMTSPNIPSCPSDLTYATSLNFNGGWCGSGRVNIGYSLPWGQIFNGGEASATRYLFVKFNPQYPVLIGGFNVFARGNPWGILTYVTVKNPSTGQTVTLGIGQGTLYDIRLLEQQNGLDPYQWNEIESIYYYMAGITMPGFFLIYTPQT